MSALLEPHRQAYLQALGLTPWVARRSVPAAAPSPVWAWPQPLTPADAVPDPVPVPTAVSASNTAPAATVEAPAGSGPLSAALDAVPSLAPVAPSDAAEPALPEAAGEAGLTLTLEALWLGSLWLVVEQDDPHAPALGRDAQGLAQGLAALWGGRSQARRRFQFPPERMRVSREETGQALDAFLRGLCRAQAGQVLLCASEAVATALQRPRYQLHQHDGLSLLVVSALDEMLHTPAEHKRRTWQALLAAGYYRRG